MKGTLSKKLLKFIIPLFSIPLFIMIVFYHSFLMTVVEKGTENVSRDSLVRLNSVIEKTANSQTNLSNYLIQEEDFHYFPMLTIIDKDFNIIADIQKINIGKKYHKYNQELQKYIKEVLKSQNIDVIHWQKMQLMVKPLLNSKNEIIAFTINDYSDFFNKKIITIDQTFFYILFIVIFVIFIGIIFTIIFAYQITHNINLFIDSTKIIATGDLSHQVNISSNDELDILANYFNNMVKKLKLMDDKIKNFNNQLKFRIDEEVKKNREKDKKMIYQSRLAQMGEMLSMIAHQWRQPLNAISSTCVHLTIKAQLDKANSEFVMKESENISKFVQHLSSTIDDFRDFFKTNKKLQNTNFTELLTAVLGIIESSVISKNIELIKDLRFEGKFKTYPNEIKQVILNLIKNAEDILLEKKIKKPFIKISTFKEGENYILEVSDNGGGVPDAVVEKIFDPYFSTKLKLDGTGLGLYMSKTIIEEHCGGKITVSNSKDGAVFKISL